MLLHWWRRALYAAVVTCLTRLQLLLSDLWDDCTADDDRRKLQHTWRVSVFFWQIDESLGNCLVEVTGSKRSERSADAWRSGSYPSQSCHQWHLLSNWGCRSVFPAELLCSSYSSRIMPWRSRQRTRPRGTSVMRHRKREVLFSSACTTRTLLINLFLDTEATRH